MTSSDYGDAPDCPLCCTELDLTDRSIQYCSCGYHMCLWCYHHILEEAGKENVPARCPNCRSVYDQEKITMQQIDGEKLEEERRKMREKDKKAGGSEAPKSRAKLANVRVVQPNLVYAVGLALEICNEDLLREQEYFGQFGKVFKISVNRSNQYASALARHGPTGSAYVTFRRCEDALRCIRLLDGAHWKGKPIKACFGTTKYCNAFLKGLPCNNPDCLYLHELADEADCLTKEEVAAGLLPARFMAMGATNTFKPRLTINPVPGGGGAAAQQGAAAAGQPMGAAQAAAAAGGAGSRASAAAMLVQQRSAAVSIAPSSGMHDGTGSVASGSGPGAGAWGSPGYGLLAGAAAGSSLPKSGGSWAAVSAAAAAPPPGPPPPPPTDAQEWPELGGPGGPGAIGPQPPSVASPDREEASSSGGGAEGMQRAGSLAPNGATMAEQLARAHSNPPDKSGAGGSAKAKKLLALASPAKLKPLAKASSQRALHPLPALADSSSSSSMTAAAAAPAAAEQQQLQPERANSVHFAAVEPRQEPAGQAQASEPAEAAAESRNKENWSAAKPAEPEERPVVQPAAEPVGARPRLAPPPGFAAPPAAAPVAGGVVQHRPKKITPPPGFGGPVSNGPISNGTTPSASNHTSIDSATALGVDADTLRAAARMSAAAAAAQQQGGGGEQKVEGYSPFAAFGAAAPGSSSMYSSLGSSGSLMDRLPSTGDLLAAGAEAAPAASGAAQGAARRGKSRFKFAQSEGEVAPAARTAEPASALVAAAGPAAPAAMLPPQQQAPAPAAYNPLNSLLQQQAQHQQAHAAPAHPPPPAMPQPPQQQQQQLQQQDVGAFFKSLFPSATVSVNSAPRQPPPGFGAGPAALPGYGSGASYDSGASYGSGDGGMYGGGAGGAAGLPGYPGAPATSASVYNPLAGMFPTQPPQQQPQPQFHHMPPQQPMPPQQHGLGGLSPGLALLRQLQGAGGGQQAQQQHQQLQQLQQQQLQQQQLHQQQLHQQQLHQQQQQQAQAAAYQQLGLSSGFVDPAIMAARPAGPPSFTGGTGVPAGMGYERPRPAMPPPGFGLQF